MKRWRGPDANTTDMLLATMLMIGLFATLLICAIGALIGSML